LVSHRLSHPAIQFCQFVQDGKVGLAIDVVAHPDKMQQYQFQRCISCSFSFAKASPIDHRTSVSDGGEGIRDDEARVIVGMKLQIGRIQSIGSKGFEQSGDAAGEGHVLVGERHPECVADPEFRSQGVRVTARFFENGFHKITNELDRRARGVLQMKAGANTGVKR